MRIGFISHGVGTQGGIESVVYHLSSQCAKLGHEACVISMRPPTEAPPGVSQIRVRVPRLPWALQQLAFAVLSRWALKKWKGDILQAHVNTFAPAQVAVCHSVHPIGSALVRSLDPDLWRRSWHWLKTLSPFIDWLSGINYRRPELKAAVATSRGIGRELSSLYPGLEKKLALIPNGFDPKLRMPAPAARRAKLRNSFGLKAGETALLFIGKEFHRKGLEAALRALPLLPKEVKLWVIGVNVDVIPTSYYLGLVRELGLEHRAAFFGHRSDLLAFYQAADAFVFPTLYEAFAMVSIESMACGLPLLAAKANGTEDLIVEGVNGAFVERSGASVAKAVKRWVLPAAKRRRLSLGALRTAKNYTWEKIAKRNLAVCRAVLGGKPLPDRA